MILRVCLINSLICVLVGADISDCFKHFVQRVCFRTKDWNDKQLFIEGKEILLKVVAQSVPVYAMSVFKILKGVCKSIMDVISKIWWGDDENNKRMH